VRKLKKNDHLCDLAPPRKKIKILRLIFGTFLEVGQPIP
jgi:hypothetical protein